MSTHRNKPQKQNQQHQQQQKITVAQTKFTSGPIPSAEELQALESVMTGLANRVVTMAEKEQNGRLEGNKRALEIQEAAIKKELSIPRRGQIFGFLSVVLLVGFCGYLAYLGNAHEAKWVAGTTIVSLAGVFVLGRKRRPNPPQSNK
jgi:uncharacterized membrane protein